MSADEDAVPFPRRGALLFAAGLVIVVLALFVSNLTIRTCSFWWYQSGLVRTELVVSEFSPHGDDPLVFGRVAATGEEIHTSLLPTELFSYDSPSDATGTLKTRDEVIGLRIPMWYGPGRDSIFGTPTIYWVSEYGTLPTARLAFTTLAVNCALGALFAWCIRAGLRTRRAG